MLPALVFVSAWVGIGSLVADGGSASGPGCNAFTTRLVMLSSLANVVAPLLGGDGGAGITA